MRETVEGDGCTLQKFQSDIQEGREDSPRNMRMIREDLWRAAIRSGEKIKYAHRSHNLRRQVGLAGVVDEAARQR